MVGGSDAGGLGVEGGVESVALSSVAGVVGEGADL